MDQATAEQARVDRCESCGLPLDDGMPQCRRLFDEVLAQHFSNPTYSSIHRLFVDAYCLQHPDRGCVSFKSFAAHATHICWTLERGGSPSATNEYIRRWVERHATLDKPPMPAARGTITIADVLSAQAPQERQQVVERWARDVWSAYTELQPSIRYWLELAIGDDVGAMEPTRAGRRPHRSGG